MPELKLIDNTKNVKITATDTFLTTSNPYILKFLIDLDSLYISTPLISFIFKHLSGNEYLYKFVLFDGREWKQNITIPVITEAYMNFNIEDFWKVSEFRPHTSIRDSIIKLCEKYGVTEIKVTWE